MLIRLSSDKGHLGLTNPSEPSFNWVLNNGGLQISCDDIASIVVVDSANSSEPDGPRNHPSESYDLPIEMPVPALRLTSDQDKYELIVQLIDTADTPSSQNLMKFHSLEMTCNSRFAEVYIDNDSGEKSIPRARSSDVNLQDYWKTFRGAPSDSNSAGILLPQASGQASLSKPFFDVDVDLPDEMRDVPAFRLKFLSIKATHGESEKSLNISFFCLKLKMQRLGSKDTAQSSQQFEASDRPKTANSVQKVDLEPQIRIPIHSSDKPISSDQRTGPQTPHFDPNILFMMKNFENSLMKNFSECLDRKLNPLIERINNLDEKIEKLAQSVSNIENLPK